MMTPVKPFAEGDRVLIVARGLAGFGGLGTVVRTGVKTPFAGDCVEVERDDGTGSDLYMPKDLRLAGTTLAALAWAGVWG